MAKKVNPAQEPEKSAEQNVLNKSQRIQTAEGWKRSMLKKYPNKKIGGGKKVS